MSSARRHIAKLIAAIALCQSAGFVGALFTTPNIPVWYVGLAKPISTPPSWVFVPVWTLLYTLMGVALFLVWTRHVGGMVRTWWLRIFLIQLVLNALWSVVFFGLHTLLGGLIVIAALWCTIVVLVALGLRCNKPSAYLLIPYLAWVSFASYLNYMFWQLNR